MERDVESAVATCRYDRLGFRGGPLAPPASFRLPPDIRRWVDEAVLVVWLEQEVLRFDWQHPLAQEYLRQLSQYMPKAMLSVLAYGYLRQVFSSESIARMCRTEPGLAMLCEGKPPFEDELLAFRRKNRLLVERVLSGVMLRAICHRFELRPDEVPTGLQQDVRQCALERMMIGRQMDMREG